MSLRKLVGPHLAGQWASNLEILRKWQPPLIVVLSPEVDKVRQLRMACPESVIVGRFFHDDSYYSDNISSRPEDFANEIHNEIIANPATAFLDYVQSNNEVCQSWDVIQKLNEFTLDWMFLADQSQAYKCAILAFSVGNPDLPDKPGDPAGFDGRMLYWQQVLPSLNYAQQKNHVLLLHAYGYPDMFHPDEDWYIYRYERQVQANLRKLGITNLKYAYGEIGIDRLIVNGKGGYKVATNDQDYTNQLLQWERDLQGQDLLLGGAIFTFGDSGGWDTYDIASTSVASMIATHYASHAGDYKPAPTGTSEPVQTHLPSINPGTTTQPALPERQIDPRLTQRGVTIETPNGAPLTWRAVKVQWYNEQEADGLGPDHHIMADVLDEQGKRLTNVPLLVTWPTGEHRITTEAKPGEPYSANYPMSPSRNEFNIKVDGLALSETVKGIGMGADTPGGFNAGMHTTTGVVFQRVSTATVPQPPPPPQPGPVTPAPQPTPSGDTWARSMAFIERWEGEYQNNPADKGNWTGCEQGKGINKGTKFGVSACSYPNEDIVNLTREQARAIFRRDYWAKSGADKLPWPLCLLVMDTAVLHGVGAATKWLQEVGPNPYAFASKRLHVYTKSDNGDTFWRGWVNRVGDLLEEMAK